MNKRTINKVNGGIAIYYGIGSILGALAGIIGTGIWLFKAFTGQAGFSWWTLGGLIIITAILGGIGYSILRVGHEELEKIE